MAFTTPVLADDDDFKSFDLVFENVALTRGASADIHVKVFVIEDDDDGVTMLAVHGYAHTAATWEPLVKELFKKDDAVSRVIAIDLPGRGGSSFPAGLPYGVLILDDYVSAILNTLERLNRLDMFPSMVIGHSQGGLLIQIIQITVEFGLQSFGIDQAVLLAPVPPDPLDWDFIDVAPTIIGGFGCFPGLPPSTPACLDVGFIGPHVAFPDSNWILLFFTNTDGEVASGAPTTDEVGQNAPEPLYVSLNLTGLSLEDLPFPPPPRPFVPAGIFAPERGTSLGVAGFQNDIVVFPNRAAEVYDWLTEDTSGSGFVLITGDETVHDMYISDPKTVADAICAVADLDCDDDDDDDDDDD